MSHGLLTVMRKAPQYVGVGVSLGGIGVFREDAFTHRIRVSVVVSQVLLSHYKSASG